MLATAMLVMATAAIPPPPPGSGPQGVDPLAHVLAALQVGQLAPERNHCQNGTTLLMATAPTATPLYAPRPAHTPAHRAQPHHKHKQIGLTSPLLS